MQYVAKLQAPANRSGSYAIFPLNRARVRSSPGTAAQKKYQPAQRSTRLNFTSSFTLQLTLSTFTSAVGIVIESTQYSPLSMQHTEPCKRCSCSNRTQEQDSIALTGRTQAQLYSYMQIDHCHIWICASRCAGFEIKARAACSHMCTFVHILCQLVSSPLFLMGGHPGRPTL